ncbi:MAG: MazG nucleotide pyrophosphohydrolase domain-containing protein [Dehalococcoidales bacterium]
MSKVNEQYREFLAKTSWYAHAGEENAKEFAYLAAGLAGETGEFVDAFKKIIRETGFDNLQGWEELLAQGGKTKLVEELGDVLWYLVRLADVLGISIQHLQITNTYKLHTRIIEREYFADIPEWPFTNPMLSKDNIRDNYFPEDIPEGESVNEEGH